MFRNGDGVVSGDFMEYQYILSLIPNTPTHSSASRLATSHLVWFRMRVGAPESVRYVIVEMMGKDMRICIEAYASSLS